MARLFDDALTQYLFNATTPITAAPLSMGCWFYADNDALELALMFVGDTASNQNYWSLFLQGGGGADDVSLRAREAAGFTDVATTTNYTINTWHYASCSVVAVDDRDVYIDGGSKGSSAVARTPAGVDAMSVGVTYRLAPHQYMSGRIKWPAIWNVALDDDEHAALATGIPPILVRPQSLVTWIYDDNDFDYVGGYDLTAVNSPTTAADPTLLYRGGRMHPPSGLFRRKSEHVMGRCR